MSRFWSVLASRSPPLCVYGAYASGFGGILLLNFVAFFFAKVLVAPLALCVIELAGSTYPVTEVLGADLNVKSKS